MKPSTLYSSFIYVAVIKQLDKKQHKEERVCLGYNFKLLFTISGKSKQGLKQLVTSHLQSRAEI